MPDRPSVRIAELAERAGVPTRTLRNWVRQWAAADRPDVVWKDGKDWVVAQDWAETVVRCGIQGPAAATPAAGDGFEAGIDRLTLDEVAHWRGRALAAEAREEQAMAEVQRLRADLVRAEALRADRDRLRAALAAFITDDVTD